MPDKEIAGNPHAVTTGREPAVEARALAYLYAAGREGTESLVSRADDALYRAKREGRDRVVSAA
jgi:GGDEF domain-containing protein